MRRILAQVPKRARSPTAGAIFIFLLLVLLILSLVISVYPYFWKLEYLYKKKWLPTGETIGTIARIPVGKIVEDHMKNQMEDDKYQKEQSFERCQTAGSRLWDIGDIFRNYWQFEDEIVSLITSFIVEYLFMCESLKQRSQN